MNPIYFQIIYVLVAVVWVYLLFDTWRIRKEHKSILDNLKKSTDKYLELLRKTNANYTKIYETLKGLENGARKNL